jgi:hypothetical protein
MSVGVAVTNLVQLAFRFIDRQGQNRDRLASAGISLVLDLEDSSWSSRTPLRSEGNAKSHSNHEPR